MNPQCQDMKTILVGEGICTATSVHLTRMPETPDTVVAIIDQPGSPPERLLEEYYKPMAQILVRGNRNDYFNTKATADSIFKFLYQCGSVLLGTTNYVGFIPTSDIIWLGYDQSDRPVFSMNFLINRSIRRI